MSPRDKWSQPVRRRRVLFGGLYFVQGVSIAYFTGFQKPYLDSQGLTPAAIGGLTGLLLLPFIGKMAFGWLSDRWPWPGFGQRKPYMALGLVLAAVGFGGAGLVAPAAHFYGFAACVLLGSLGIAMFDAATDGLAIDLVHGDEQARVQGFMVGGRALGVILLSLLFGMLVADYGYRPVFWIMAAAALAPLVGIIRLREPSGGARLRVTPQPGMVRRLLVFAGYALAYSITSYGLDGLITYAMNRQYHLDVAIIGQYGALRGIGAVCGALAGSWLLSRMARLPVALGSLVMLAGTALSAIGIERAEQFLAFGLAWGIVWGMQEAVFLTFAMNVAAREAGHHHAALCFAFLMACSNAGTAVSEVCSTALVAQLGFHGVYLGLAVWTVVAVVPLLASRRMLRVSEQAA